MVGMSAEESDSKGKATSLRGHGHLLIVIETVDLHRADRLVLQIIADTVHDHQHFSCWPSLVVLVLCCGRNVLPLVL
jgi:hypothetical protein